MEYYKMTAYELSKQLQEKKISSAELTAAVFERIEQTEEKVDAYITLNKEAALRKAAEVDKKRSDNAEMSNLAGIPIGKYGLVVIIQDIGYLFQIFFRKIITRHFPAHR